MNIPNSTYEDCKNNCMSDNSCFGFSMNADNSCDKY